MSAEETAPYYLLALAATGIIAIALAAFRGNRPGKLKPWVDSRRF